MYLGAFLVPDEVFIPYAEQNPTQPDRALVAQLKRFSHVKLNERPIVFVGEDRKRLEKLFGQPIDESNAKAFIDWVEEMSNVSVDEFQIHLRVGQRKLIQGEADHYKLPFKEVAKKKIEQALDGALGVY